MGAAAVGVVGGVVAPFGEDLAGKTVPITVEQRPPFLFGHGGKAGEISRVVVQ